MTVVIGRRAAVGARLGAQVADRHRTAVVVQHRSPLFSNICSNNVRHSDDIRPAQHAERGVHVRVHERGADSSTPLVPLVPPTGIEPATFGTGNPSLLQSEYSREHENRGITRMSDLPSWVYPGTQWVHQWAHLDGGVA